MEVMTQRVELLSVAPGKAQSGEPTVVLTIRPDRSSFRPHNIAISRPQAIRLLRSLRTVLRQSASAVLFGLALGSLAGCSTEVKVTTEKTVPRAAVETAPVATEERTTTDVAVRFLDEQKPSPVVERSPVQEPVAAPEPDPKQAVEIVGDRNSVVVVEGDLHLHRHVHIHEAARSEHVQVEIRSYDVERDERCERLRREYETKVRQLRRMFYD